MTRTAPRFWYSALVFLLLAVLIGMASKFTWTNLDDGVYAMMAERMVNGEIPNRDFQSGTLGYDLWVNALAYKLFGQDLYALRVPLVGLFALIGTFLFRKFGAKGLFFGAAVAVFFVAETYLQFINPTRNWYCLGLAVLLFWQLERWSALTTGRLLQIGLIIGVCFGMRHYSGVVLGIAFTLLMYYRSCFSEPVADDRSVFAAVLSAIILLGCGLFLTAMTYAVFDFLSILIYLSPLLVLVGYLLLRSQLGSVTLVRQLFTAFGGFLLALVPIVVYQLLFADLTVWADEILAVSFNTLAVNSKAPFLYWEYPLFSYLGAIKFDVFYPYLTTAYWTLLNLIPVTLCVVFIKRIYTGREMPAWTILAVVWAYVGLHSQIYMHFAYMIGLTTVGLLVLFELRSVIVRTLWSAALLFTSFVGVYFHTFDVKTTGYVSILIGGHTPEQFAYFDHPKIGIYADRRVKESMEEAAQFIRERTSPEDTIFAYPMDPLIHYLAERRSPLRNYNPPLWVVADYQREEAAELFRKYPPKAIVVNRGETVFNGNLAAIVSNYVDFETAEPDLSNLIYNVYLLD